VSGFATNPQARPPARPFRRSLSLRPSVCLRLFTCAPREAPAATLSDSTTGICNSHGYPRRDSNPLDRYATRRTGPGPAPGGFGLQAPGVGVSRQPCMRGPDRMPFDATSPQPKDAKRVQRSSAPRLARAHAQARQREHDLLIALGLRLHHQLARLARHLRRQGSLQHRQQIRAR